MIRLVASDLDGTLLDSYRRITETNREAIRKLQENGIEFIINTGREYQNAIEIAKEANLTCGFICSNGASGYDEKGNLLFEHFIPPENVKKILSVFHEMGFTPNIFTNKGRLSLLSPEELKVYTKEVMIPSMQVSHPDFHYSEEDFQQLLKNVIFIDGEESLYNGEHQILKIISQNPDPEKLPVLANALKKIPGLSIANTSTTDIEITSSEAQKGLGLMDYAKRRGYTADEIVAIGDSGNDYSMLSLPGIHSVAMANATEEIQNICVYRTRDNKNDGIAYIIKCILTDRNNFELR